MTVRQSVRVEDHGPSHAPTSFREVAVDHILLATTDLGTASQALSDRLGLQAVEGGRHPDWGTANWIVPVGDAYLELVAVVDERVAERTAFCRWVASANAPVVKPIGWAVRTGSLDAVATRLGLTVHAGSRASPTGERLTWRLAGIERAAAEPIIPFFIERGAKGYGTRAGPSVPRATTQSRSSDWASPVMPSGCTPGLKTRVVRSPWIPVDRAFARLSCGRRLARCASMRPSARPLVRTDDLVIASSELTPPIRQGVSDRADGGSADGAWFSSTVGTWGKV